MPTAIGWQDLILIAIVSFTLGAVAVSMSALAGYWAGRNSRELPFRSTASPRREKAPERSDAIPEPEQGDIYAEAAYGEDRAPVPTIMEGRR